MQLALGVSMGRSESGLCPTRNRPDDIGFPDRKPAADCKNNRSGRIELERSAVESVEANEVLSEVPFGRRFVFFARSESDWCKTN